MEKEETVEHLDPAVPESLDFYSFLERIPSLHSILELGAGNMRIWIFFLTWIINKLLQEQSIGGIADIIEQAEGL